MGKFATALGLIMLAGAYYVYSVLSDGSGRVAAIGEAKAAILRAETAKLSYASNRSATVRIDNAVREMNRYIKDVDDDKREPSELRQKITELDAMLEDLRKNPRSAAPTPASPPLGPGLRPIPPPPPLGGGDPVRPPIASAPAPAPATSTPAAPDNSRCAMDAYAHASLRNWCRALAPPRPSQCDCVTIN